jgi:putative ABC transport system permease protein
MRLARLALAESLLLSLIAGSVGLLMAFALLQTSVAMAPPGIPGIAAASVDARVFTVAVVLVVVTGVAIGLWPAISVFRAGAFQGCARRAPPRPAPGRVSGSRWSPRRSR